ncbi:MAG: amino-acid racemase [Microbacteriaceae bacterium]|nr:amino-acid racemase [Microbacteriaceae bacterium]
MFLTNLIEQNPEFARAVIDLHQSGALPPDCYVIDLDTMGENARSITEESHRLGMEVIAMTKQFGRHPAALRTLRENGVDSFVAVDMTCARAITRTGQPLGHVGHLVQIPRHLAEEASSFDPANWTVFSQGKAAEAAGAALSQGRTQNILARIYGEGDVVIESHAGGFAATDIVETASAIDELDGGRFAGVTSYPALVFDREKHVVRPTPNLRTLEQSIMRLADAGWNDIVVNAPGETSTAVLADLANAGVTQVEPGHGFTATGAYHAFAPLPERPAMVYLSEVSHLAGDNAYCFGGGLYLCVGSVEYQPTAIVGADFESAIHQRVDAALEPNHQVIDFYGRLPLPERNSIRPGDSVLFCFRAQAFYTRSLVAAVSGVQTGAPVVEGIYTVDGRAA